ncbi:MAG: tetratricopeptide repeat protein [Chloroflexi bacterium]|nr:tetratricopeptide repeat protein [Chloroflexota bacterium]
MASIIDKYMVQIQEKADLSGIYAYRGQPKAEWRLLSAATRRLISEHGDSIMTEPELPELYINYHRDTLIEPARARGYDVDSGRRLSDLELLAKLQHLGAPTGLLDFSWSPLVALWFACVETESDGKLFMVNMNDAVRVIRLNNDLASEGLTTVLGELETPPRIFYWEPSVTGEAAHRIIRQRSVFIIGGPNGLVDDGVTSQIHIPEDDKEKLLAELALMDYDHGTMFFDVHGFAQGSRWTRVPDLTPDVYIRRANRFYQQGNFELAIDHYNHAIQLAPERTLAYFLRGNALATCGRHQEAVEDYDEVIPNVGPLDLIDQSIVYFNRGNSKAELRLDNDAVADYTRAITIRPDRSEYYYNRGNSYADLGESTQAIDDYDVVVGRSGGHAAFNKGNALLSMGLLDAARASYLLAEQRGTDHDAVNQNLFALNQIRPLFDPTKHVITPASVVGENRIVLEISDPDQGQVLESATRQFLIYGRAGNSGNMGGPDLEGSAGAPGRPLTMVEIRCQI